MSLVDPEHPMADHYRANIRNAQTRDRMQLQPDESVEHWQQRVEKARRKEPS